MRTERQTGHRPVPSRAQGRQARRRRPPAAGQVPAQGRGLRPVAQWRARMAGDEIKDVLYKQRAATAECVGTGAQPRTAAHACAQAGQVRAVAYLFALAHNLMRYGQDRAADARSGGGASKSPQRAGIEVPALKPAAARICPHRRLAGLRNTPAPAHRRPLGSPHVGYCCEIQTSQALRRSPVISARPTPRASRPDPFLPLSFE